MQTGICTHPILEALVVYRFTESGVLLVQSAQQEERVFAEPFTTISISVRDLLDGETGDD